MDEVENRPKSELERRTFLAAGGSLVFLAAVGTQLANSDPAAAYVAGYNLPFTNLAEAGTIVPVYDSGDGWHTRPGGGHHGIDFNGPGTVHNRRVYPIRPGVVTHVQYDSSGSSTELGNLVSVTHADGVISKYAHLNSIAVSTGAAVGAGTMLGQIGNTGTSSNGSHLHLAVFPSGNAHDVNPWPLVSGAPYANQVSATIPPVVEEDDMPTGFQSTRSIPTILPQRTWAQIDAAQSPTQYANLVYNDSVGATNIAELVGSKTIFDLVMNLYISNLPAGEFVNVRLAYQDKTSGLYSGIASVTIVGTTSKRVRGLYSTHATLNQGTHRLIAQAAASTANVSLDLWRVDGLAW